jgi:excisionase family DNA binding protein
VSNDSNEILPHVASLDDVAAHFGVHSDTIRRWLRSPNPPPHRKVGRQYRFNLAEVDAWAAEGPSTRRTKAAV